MQVLSIVSNKISVKDILILRIPFHDISLGKKKSNMKCHSFGQQENSPILFVSQLINKARNLHTKILCKRLPATGEKVCFTEFLRVFYGYINCRMLLETDIFKQSGRDWV